MSQSVALDIAPLLDVVFILLIFFLVTTSFVRDVGVDVTRPQAQSGKAIESASFRVAIARSGQVFVNGEALELAGLGEAVRRFLVRDADGAVILIADERVPTGRLVEVMDACKQAGAEHVAIATERRRRG